MEAPSHNQPERWRPVRECPRYEVSDLGRVRNAQTGYVLSPFRNSDPRGLRYLRVTLYPRDASKPLHRYVSRLVAAAWVPGRTKERCEVHHRDGDILNNAADNLLWTTPSENLAARFMTDAEAEALLASLPSYDSPYTATRAPF